MVPGSWFPVRARNRNLGTRNPLALAGLPISLSTLEDFENGLNGLVLFVAEFPLDSRNHVPGPEGLIHFVLLGLQL
jgi:hypothetical protein